MTVAADISTDYQYIDGIEAVTFTDLDSNDTANVYALRGGLNYKEAALVGTGAYQASSMTWELWSATLGGEIPVAGCIVTDANSVAYSIISAVEVAIGTQSIKWRCVCNKRL